MVYCITRRDPQVGFIICTDGDDGNFAELAAFHNVKRTGEFPSVDRLRLFCFQLPQLQPRHSDGELPVNILPVENTFRILRLRIDASCYGNFRSVVGDLRRAQTEFRGILMIVQQRDLRKNPESLKINDKRTVRPDLPDRSARIRDSGKIIFFHRHVSGRFDFIHIRILLFNQSSRVNTSGEKRALER